MKQFIYVFTLLTLLFTSNSLLVENYYEINISNDILLNDKEFQIHTEFIKIIIPNEFIIYNIEAILKADTEFLFYKSYDLIQNDLNEDDYFKTKEETLYLNEDISKISLANDIKRALYINIKDPESHKVTLKIKKLFESKNLADDISKEDCEIIKSNLKELMEKAYIFLDYAKNPKQPEGFPNYFQKVDFINDLDKIKTENRNILDFYRDIKEAIGKFKDLHLNILYTEFLKSFYCLPFTFTMSGDEQNNPKLYIDKSLCFDLFPEEQKKAIELLLDKPIKTIAGKDPFDYIQNFVGNKYLQSKNRHATFNMHLNSHEVDIPSLANMPLLEEELSDIAFTFEGENNPITLTYILAHISEKAFTQEFNNYFNQELEESIKKNNVHIPNLFEVQKKFLLKKKIKNKVFKEKEKNENELEWDVIFQDDDEKIKFKCRADHLNEVNVMYQNTFDFKNQLYAYTYLSFCANLFGSNTFPLIIIESQNNGGSMAHALFMIELFQPLIENKDYISFKPTDELYNTNFTYSELKDCKTIKLSDDKKKETDDYGDGVTLTRTPIYNCLNKEIRKAFEEYRNGLKTLTEPRDPTKIIIFTDGFSYSATSFLIKGFQKNGGAITVGYMGNPNIKGTDEFDASQSPSQVYDFKETDYYKNLNEKGFQVAGITIGETFSNSHEKNQIPREYQLNPVDERVNIYEAYSDDLYNKFILEGLLIFKKYESECNPKNKKLTLFSSDCMNIAEHTHGGKVCGENGKWSSKCVPVYCDSGYYFDDYTNKCVEDVCLKEDNKGKIANINYMVLAMFILSILF